MTTLQALPDNNFGM